MKYAKKPVKFSLPIPLLPTNLFTKTDCIALSS